jgi:hypothetical protein
MDGNLSLIAEFPDREPVLISSIAEMDTDPPKNGKRAHV